MTDRTWGSSNRNLNWKRNTSIGKPLNVWLYFLFSWRGSSKEVAFCITRENLIFQFNVHQRKAENVASKTIYPLFHQHHYVCNYHISLSYATCRAQILKEHFSYRKRCCLLSVLRQGWTENRIYSVIVAAEGIYQHPKSKSNITIPLLNHAMPWLGQINADGIKFVFRPLTVLSRTVRRKWASEPSFLITIDIHMKIKMTLDCTVATYN